MSAAPVPSSWHQLHAGAVAGDAEAWAELCSRLRRLVWRVVNGFGFSSHDAQEAYAATFFRIADRLTQVRDPEYLPGWTASIARNESRKIVSQQRRATLFADADTVAAARDQPAGPFGTAPAEPGSDLLRRESVAAVRAGLARLSERCRELLRLVTADPPLGYDSIAELLDMPRGSIGPTRSRCLDSLRATESVAALIDGGTIG